MASDLALAYAVIAAAAVIAGIWVYAYLTGEDGADHDWPRRRP